MNTHSSLPEESEAGEARPLPTPAAEGGVLSWLRSCIASALLGYVRAQHPVHPDLLDSMKDDGADQPSTHGDA